MYKRQGVDCDGLLSELDTLIRRLPKVSGGSGEVYASPETGKVLSLAEKTAEKLHDDYISVEHLMLAILSEGTSDVKQLLQSHGITRSRFTDELSKVKTTPVTVSYTHLLKADTDEEKYSEYLDGYRLYELVKKYSDYIRYPIRMLRPTRRVKAGSDLSLIHI